MSKKKARWTLNITPYNVVHVCGHEKEYSFPLCSEDDERANKDEILGLALLPCVDCRDLSDPPEEDEEPWSLPCWNGCGKSVPTDALGMLPVFCSDECKNAYIALHREKPTRPKLEAQVTDPKMRSVLITLYEHLSSIVPIEIEYVRQRGGPTDDDIERTLALWHANALEIGAGHATVYLDPGQTAIEMSILSQMIAIMSFVPGGVCYGELCFDAAIQQSQQAQPRGIIDDKFVEELEEAWRNDPSPEAQYALAHRDDPLPTGGRRAADMTDEEYRAVIERMHEFARQLSDAHEAGDPVQIALIEAQWDAYEREVSGVVQPQPVVVEPIQAVQQALFDEIGA